MPYEDPRITHTSVHHFGDPREGQQARVWFPRFDPSDIAATAHDSCDSGGFYWISKNVGHGLLNINRVADQGVTTDAVGRASVLVNGGGYGNVEWQAYAPFIERFRGDSVATNVDFAFVVVRSGRSLHVYVDFTPQRPR